MATPGPRTRPPRPGAGEDGTDADPGPLVDLARQVAVQAADLLLESVSHRRSRVDTKSSGTDMVTEMDRASEDLIVGALLAARPDDGILAEEGSARGGTSGVRWVVDPLDGTTNYLYGHPGWGVSVAAETDGGVLAGVVVDPVHGEVYTAARGRGARRNDEPIHVSDQTELAHTLVATGFGYRAERRRAQAEVLSGLLPQVRDIRRMGAAAVDLCSVACGRVDAFYERGLSWWDCAAGALIAQEAGAVVESLDGSPLATAEFVLAATPGVAAPLRVALDALGAHRVP